MGAAVIVRPEHRWECPNCPVTDVTQEARPHVRFHACRGLKGLTSPLVPAGTKCKIEAEERGDYVGREIVQTNGEGRPVMAVVTTRDDGTDRVVLAPTATMRGE